MTKVRGDFVNEKFYSLPEEQQTAIFNAAMEVFGENEYKRASTDLIAQKAGISKGLLFYYFKNKKELYLQTFDYVYQVGKAFIDDDYLKKITDFFELISYSTIKKLTLSERNPHIFNFTLRAYYSEREEPSEEIKERVNELSTDVMQSYFKNIDYSKFEEGIDVLQYLNMLQWMIDGYLHMQHLSGKVPSHAEIQEQFDIWIEMFKKTAYKEEFQ